MADMKKWALIISAVAIVSGVLSALVPEGKMKKAYKTLGAVVMIYAVLLPLINSDVIDFRIDDYLQDNYEVSEKMDKYARQAIVNSAEKAIEDLLYESAEEKGLSCKFKAQCDVIDEKIIVSSVNVTGAKTQSQKDLISDIVVGLGFKKETIVYSGENDEYQHR